MGKNKKKTSVGTYIDLFSGCGGFSLGLGNAGWKGLFAIEKDAMAFDTFRHNLIDGKYAHFDWPEWLPKKNTTIQTVLKTYKNELLSLRGKVDLIAGGPPCQGFSMAGQRNPNDPRNKLSNEYLKMVEIINPKYVVLENVRGFNSTFAGAKGNKSKIPYSLIVKGKLEKLGYTVYTSYVNAQDFGVPQQRTRFILIGIQNSLVNSEVTPFKLLNDLRFEFLKEKSLPTIPITVKQAISDLEIRNKSLIEYPDSNGLEFKQINYVPPKKLNAYQSLVRNELNGLKPTGLRLPRHKASTIEKFEFIQKISRPGIVLNAEEKELVGTKKQAICVLNPNNPSKTLTTLPDDLLHYSEPRILTVRENARIQSFPDDFEFKGKYTTGGKERKKECPKYTQVGNAVPPFLGEALGLLISSLEIKSNKRKL